VEGLQRFPINVRYPRELRDSVEKLRALPIVTERGAQITLGAIARLAIEDGPPMLKSENARLSGWVYVDIRGRDLQSVVRDAQRAVLDRITLPPGYSISWSGQFEFLERATRRLQTVVPFTLVIIFVLLYLTFRSVGDALLIMLTVPFALIGGFWLMWMLGYNMSVASAVGFIALAGVAIAAAALAACSGAAEENAATADNIALETENLDVGADLNATDLNAVSVDANSVTINDVTVENTADGAANAAGNATNAQ